MTPEQQADLDAWNMLGRRSAEAFAKRFKLSPLQADILDTLWRWPGFYVETGELVFVNETSRRAVYFAVSKLRLRLPLGSVVVVKGSGYGLTETGREACRLAINADLPRWQALGERGGQAA